MASMTQTIERKTMKKPVFSKDILPHLLAVFIFLIISIIFFKPVFFEGKKLSQHDILQGRASAKEALDYREKTGEEPLWTNSMFSGMPAYLINTRYSGELMKYGIDLYSLWLKHPARLLFMAFVSFYILLLAFKVRPYLAIGGAIAFGLSTFNIISLEAGHNSKVFAIAMMPLVLAGIHLAFRKKYILAFLVTAFAMYAELNANHLQITYYLLLMVLIYGLVQLIFAVKENRTASLFKSVGILVLAVILAVGANFGRLATLLEYGKYSIRGGTELTSDQQSESGLEKDYAFQWSNGKLETMTLLIPNFYGGASTQKLEADSELGKALKRQGARGAQIRQYTEKAPTYWGDQPFTAGPIYAGAIVVFLFILGLFFADKKYIYWLVAATVLSLMLSWGKNFEAFNYFIFDYLPGYNKFRAVSMALVIALTAMPLLGFLGLERFLEKGLTKENQKSLLIATGISAGLCLVYIILAGMMSFKGAVDAQMPDWFSKALQADRQQLGRSDAFRSIFFILATTAVIYFWLKNRLSSQLAGGLIALLILLDLGFVDHRYLNDENFQRDPQRAFVAPTQADLFIKKDKDPHYRVYNLQNPFNDARTSYHHHSIGGYHGAKMRRYQDLIERAITTETSVLISDLQNQQFNADQYHVLNMLNAKYFVAGPQAQQVIQNPAALGNVWFVSNVQKVNSPDEEIAAVNEINTAKTAVIDASKFDISQTTFSGQASGKLTNYDPKHMTYEVNAQAPALAVFSEVYYPKGWTATIDGKEVDIKRVNYVLRALEIPAGKHTVEFKFNPQSYRLGNTVMLISSVLFYLLLIGGIVYSIKKYKDLEDVL